MKFFNDLERRFSRYALAGIMRYLTVLYAIGFALSIYNYSLYYERLSLDMAAIFRGEIWRLVTWLMYPPSPSLIWGLLMIYLYYSLGNTLEYIWGKFRFNIFIFMGIFFHILAALIIYLASGISFILTPDNLNMSIFLAFALTFPEMEFRLYFVLPIKAKVLAIFYLAIEALSFITGRPESKLSIFLGLLNFIIFFMITGYYKNLSIFSKKQRDFRQKMKPQTKQIRHKCSICGRTDESNPELEFRYCSKCNGSYEYCSDHIFTHKHVE